MRATSPEIGLLPIFEDGYDINVSGQIVVSKTGPDNSGLGLIIIEDDKYWFEKVGVRLWSNSGALE